MAVRLSSGQGQNGTGASLRVAGTGNLVYNTSTLNFGGNSVDLHAFELSWLGFAHFQRPNASTAYTQTMVTESTGRWRDLRGLAVDGQLSVTSIALNGADLAATLASITARVTSLETQVPA